MRRYHLNRAFCTRFATARHLLDEGAVIRRVAAIFIVGIVAGACATPPPPPSTGKLYDDKGVRQRELTPEEAEKMIQARADQIRVCYGRERMNLDQKVGNYVFRVWIPTDGSGADVEVVKETVPGLITLRGCLEDVLTRIKFPAHIGEPITLMVPIEKV